MKRVFLLLIIALFFVSCDPPEALFPRVFLHSKLYPEVVEENQDFYIEIFIPNDDDYYIVTENKQTSCIEKGELLDNQYAYIIKPVQYDEDYLYCKIRYNFSECGKFRIYWGGLNPDYTVYDENIFDNLRFKDFEIVTVE